jgi:PKD repeat protein
MTSPRGAVAALLSVLAWATPAAAQQAPLGGGAWSWFGDPRAVYVPSDVPGQPGKTFVGWVDLEGDIKVMSYDHASGNRVTAVLQARLNQDDHANPSIHVRPDGHLVVFYSRHVGPAMHYRVSSRPGDVRSWEAPRTVPTNVAGRFGYTYPNPIRLEDEAKTYLFWRGGNYNPTYSIQNDGSDSWSAARNLIRMAGERPYTKYAASGGDTIHVAYTNAHPAEFGDVNMYYARVRAGRIERAGGQQIGTLDGDPIAPDQGDLIFSERSWVHDVAADSSDRPVIVFASLPSATDHRYHYARWTGSAWQVNEMTRAGGSFRGDGGSPYYSGGLTLDHEDPSRVYMSRQIGEGVWRVEVWTTANQGATWTSQVISGPGKNVRPVSPRGMDVFGGDLSVIWMLGRYDSWVDYGTSIVSLLDGGNAPPVADAEPAVRSGPAPLEVRFDGSFSHDSDGAVVDWEWDFDDATPLGSGEQITHTYTAAGRYFPALTVTDSSGATSTLVEEIVVGLPSAPTTHTGGASGVTAHGAIDPENQITRWSFEYGPTADYGAVTETQTLPGADALRQVSTELPGLEAGRLYHYRLVATNDSGTTEGEDRVMVAGRTPGSDAYREAVLATPGLASYWRLGELSGITARNDRTGGGTGSFLGRFVLGQPGALGALGNTAASFDGLSGELTVPGPALQTNGTLEGWFRWRAGTAVLRDNSERSPNGWLLAFNSGGDLRYRLGGGRDLITNQPIGLVRDGAWHHIAATKEGAGAALYVDGSLVHSGAGAGSEPAAGPWHVMRNGLHTVFSEGEADEIAMYTRALTAGEVRAHYDRARELATAPLPPESPPPAAEPPAAGSGPGGGVLDGGAAGGVGGGAAGVGAGLGGGAGLSGGPGSQPAGRAFVRGSRLIVQAAAGTDNRLTARQRGARWRITDAAAPLRAGAGCRRLAPKTVSCRAAAVKRIEMHGGTGADTLIVRGRTRALLVGGPGADHLAGGPGTRFRGGPGTDTVSRR